MSRHRWALAIAIIAVLVVAVFLWKRRGADEAPKYRTAAVEQGPIEAVVSATGTIRPVVQVEVGSQVSGTVYRISADYNSRVRAGQVLCQIEPSSFRARVVQNQAAVAKAEVAVKDANRVLGRQRALLKDDYVSQAEVEAAEVAVEQRQADLRQARAQLDVAELDLEHATIRAPIDGVVIARSIDLGQTVAASLQAPKLFVIANDLSRMQVETRIDEADIGRIHSGLPVTFTVDAYPDLTFDGEVSQVRLEPIVEQGVVTYTTVIRTGNPGQRLKPGMTANVTVLVAKRDDVLKVPVAALRFRPPMREGQRGGVMAAAMTGGGAAGAASRAGGGSQGRPGQAGESVRRTDGAKDPSAGGGAGDRASRGSTGTSRGSRESTMRQGAGGGLGGGGSVAGRWRALGGDTAMFARMRALRDQAESGDTAAQAELARMRERFQKMREGMGGGGGRPGPGGGFMGMGGGSMGTGGTVTPRGTERASARPAAAAAEPEAGPEPPQLKPGLIYVLRNGKPGRVAVMTGLSDGAWVEVQSDQLGLGDPVIVGLDLAVRGQKLQPPPGMGGPTFGGGRPGGGGTTGGGRR